MRIGYQRGCLAIFLWGLYVLSMKYGCILFLLALLAGCVAPAPVSRPAVIPPAPLPPISLTLEPPTCVSVVAVGDMMLGGTASPVLRDKGYDYPFAATQNLLAAADITVGNLETALTHGGTPFEKKYNFRNPPEKVAPALKRAGFDLVSLANNHTMDYGAEGLADTLQALREQELLAVGAGMDLHQARQPVIIARKGQKLGFLAYSLTFPEAFWAEVDKPGAAFGHAAHIRADVAALAEQVDHVLVQFHWGREGTTQLRDYQVALGRAAIDAGATVVLGHHPHILQAIERYKAGVIYYSLGNFAFGSYSNKVQAGGVAELELCPGRLKRYGLTLVDVNNFRVHFQPRPLDELALQTAYKSLYDLSALRQTQLQRLGEKIIGVLVAGE